MSKRSPASILKSKGLIPKSWDLRKPLSRGQKSWVTKLTQPAKVKDGKVIREAGPLRQVILKPKEYTALPTPTRKGRKESKGGGFAVVNRRTVVHHGKGGGAKRNKAGDIVIRKSDQEIEVWFANSKNFLARVEAARKYKLKRNQTWGFSIGSHAGSDQWRDFNQLMHYLTNKTDWHSPSATDYVNLVLITEHRQKTWASNLHRNGDWGDDDEDEDYEDE